VPEDPQEHRPEPLVLFCTEFLSRHRNNWPPSEDTLAREFLSAFPVSPFLTRAEVEALCSGLRIEVSFRPLPSDFTGYNCKYGEKKEIVLGEKEAVLGVITHSCFHEIREIIEGVFNDLGHSIALGNELEERAEQFAVAVRMNSANQTFEFLLAEIDNISSTWRRWGSLILVSILYLGHGAGCILLPHFEGRMTRDNN